ncbi:MAG: urease accessory protein UreD [Thermoproteota archaeon]
MFCLSRSPKPLLDAEKHLEDVNKLEYYIPSSIPPEVLAYASKLDQLGVGKAGKLGGLILGLEKDETSKKTAVKQQYSRVPLYTQRALYLEEALPSMAYMYIISPSGGILQGDRYRMDITLRKDAMAHLTTQGATRVYRMEKNFATQIVNITVDQGCYLEYIPDQIIPYRSSRFYQIANLHVHDNATLVYSEMVTPGRVAGGEHFDYDICYMKTVAKNQNDRTRCYDVAILEPKKRNMGAFGILEKHDVFGTVYVITGSEKMPKLYEKISQEIANVVAISGGASILPDNSGIIVRLLGNTASEVRSAIFEVVRSVRKVVLNAPFSGIRKG